MKRIKEEIKDIKDNEFMITKIAKNKASTIEKEKERKEKVIKFIKKYNICPECGNKLRTMNSNFAMMGDIKICEKENKRWMI